MQNQDPPKNVQMYIKANYVIFDFAVRQTHASLAINEWTGTQLIWLSDVHCVGVLLLLLRSLHSLLDVCPHFLRSIHTKDCVKRKCTVFTYIVWSYLSLCQWWYNCYNGYLGMTNRRLIPVQCAVSAGVRMQNFRSALTWQPPQLSEYHHLHFHLILNFPFWMADAEGAAGPAKWVSISIKLADIFWHFTTAVYTEKKSKLHLNEYAEWGEE